MSEVFCEAGRRSRVNGAAAVALTVAFVLVAALFAAVAPSIPASAKGEVVKIGVLPIEDNLPFYVAEKEGFFAAEGVAVELVPFNSAIERDTAIRAGQIDGVITDLLAVIFLEKSGIPVAITSVALGEVPQEGRFAILAAPGAKIQTVADLKNVPIGISNNSIIEYVTDQLLSANGLKAQEIVKVEIPKIPIRLDMLLNGKLQAATLPDPLAALAEARGARVIVSDTAPGPAGNLSQVVLAFQKRSISGKRAEIQKMYAAYRRAVSAINARPDVYRELLIDKARVPEEIKETYPLPHYPMPKLPQKQDFDRVVKWMLEKKLIDRSYAYGDLTDGQFAAAK
ncbi:MAG: ABC transporter substrate-binding protein [Syntrophothermus sp.]